MAQATEVTELIDRSLHYAHAMVDDLIDVTREWHDLPDWERASWSLDWDQFALLHLKDLDLDYHADRMSPDQVVRYQYLLNRLRKQQPTIERFRLAAPAISVGT